MDPRKFLNSLFEIAVAKAQPGQCVPPFLSKLDFTEPTVVFGAGKASAAMAQAVEQHTSAALEGLVITRYGHAVECQQIKIVEAGHPVPDKQGMRAAASMLEIASGLTEKDSVLCLISGGGSSLLSLPAPGLSLEDKQGVTSKLLKCGATIHEINCIRKHLSAIKGGRLAVACSPAPLLTLAISDVPGDDLSVIASGPTVADPSTFEDALKILTKYDISEPKSVLKHLENADDEGPTNWNSLTLWAEKVSDSTEFEVDAVGVNMLFQKAKVVAEDDLTSILIPSVLFLSLVMYLVIRDWKISMITLGSVGLIITAEAGLISALGFDISIIDAIAFPIILAVAVDGAFWYCKSSRSKDEVALVRAERWLNKLQSFAILKSSIPNLDMFGQSDALTW